MSTFHIADRSDAFLPAEVGHANPKVVSNAFTTFRFNALQLGQNLVAKFQAFWPSQGKVAGKL
jgi:hypothetical protein